ncbi:peptidoglycan-recognition protein SC2-like [Patiria miniata]|uniref:Peptidoglycan-recognition protein n=1 Tax=Patiria miniata TaxID=46514 RepID=A0A914A677_PATMI|nr:peptidoglycan-recognition protein SC2-like [Patiria miniata]
MEPKTSLVAPFVLCLLLVCHPASACRDTEYTCDNGSCISSSWVCDDDYDCPGRDDEACCECAGLTFVSRSDWSARSPSSTTAMSGTPDYTVVHHTATGSCSTTQTCSANMVTFQRYHMDTNDWDDIGYNFVIGGDGKVYVGRGWGTVGAHAPGYNFNSVGIAIIGNYGSSLPSSGVLCALRQLMECGVELGNLPSSYKMKAHRDVRTTECPGDALYNEIKTWSHYEA